MSNADLSELLREDFQLRIENADLKERIEEAEKQFKILNETMQHVTVMYDNAITRAEKAEAEVERLTRQIKDDNRAYGCELRDPYGTIWEQAAKDHARAEKAEAECLEQARLLGMSGEREADLLGKLERLAKDKARLDWLAVSDVWFDFPATGAFTPETFRAAIDAAMKS